MRRVGIREFKNQATTMMSSGETLVIERHGVPIGFFVPVTAQDRKAGQAALGRLGRFVDELLADSGVEEEELATELSGVLASLVRVVVDASVLVGELLRARGRGRLAEARPRAVHR